MKLKQFSHGFQIANPIFLISTWFGVGFLPLAPGTWGSLAALPVAWLITNYLGQTFLLVFTILLIYNKQDLNIRKFLENLNLVLGMLFFKLLQ